MQRLIRPVILGALCTTGALAATTGLVVRVNDPQAVTGVRVEPHRAADLFERGLRVLTGAASSRAAWQTLVSTNDVVAIKITTEPGPLLASHRPLIEAIVAGLRDAGLPATQIHVLDRDPTKIRDAGFEGLAQPVINGTGWDPRHFYEQNLVGKLIWGDLLFGHADDGLSIRSHLPRVIAQAATKLINVAVLRDSEATGLAGCLHNLSLGLVDNTRRFDLSGPATDRAIAEINALPLVRQKVILHLLDALVGAPTGNGTLKARYTWPCASLYFGTDPVALDTLALELLDAQRQELGLPPAAERAHHIAAAARLGLGQADRAQIRVVSDHPREDRQE